MKPYIYFYYYVNPFCWNNCYLFVVKFYKFWNGTKINEYLGLKAMIEYKGLVCGTFWSEGWC